MELTIAIARVAEVAEVDPTGATLVKDAAKTLNDFEST